MSLFVVKHLNNSRAVQGCRNEMLCSQEEAAAWFLGLALPVLLAQRRHPASHAGVRGSENSPEGIQAALIAYLLLP